MIKILNEWSDGTPPGRLGRHVNHDPRSLRYLVPPRGYAAKTVFWDHKIPVLDQGNLGSCTGNATVGVLGSAPYFDTLANITLDENLAVSIYSKASSIDPFPGSYPPQDTGSDGLSAAKAAQSMGLISGYLHATSLDATLTALQAGPVITGVRWYSGFDNPDSNGVVHKQGTIRGGHEFALLGCDVDKRYLLALNSWGESWGLNGTFKIPFDDFAQLLAEDGDVTSFVPRTSPAPTPKPVDPVDVQLLAAGNAWEKTVWSKFTKAGRFKTAFDDWKSAKGY